MYNEPETGACFPTRNSKAGEAADKRGLPPYTIFSDATMLEIVKIRPTNFSALKSVKGIGDEKIKRYGDAILAIVRVYGK